ILRELQLRDRGVQVELLVETHRGGKVGVGTGVLRRAGRSGRSGFFSGGDRWRGGNEQGSEKEEAHARKATRGTRASRKTEVEEGAPVTDHRVVLPSLQPSTQYRYRVEGGHETAWFTSAPQPDGEGPIHVVVSGDNRTNDGDHALVARAAAAERPQLALHTGN